MLIAKAPDQDSARRELVLEVAKCSMLPRSQGFSPLSDEDEDNEEMGNFTLGDLGRPLSREDGGSQGKECWWSLHIRSAVYGRHEASGNRT